MTKKKKGRLLVLAVIILILLTSFLFSHYYLTRKDPGAGLAVFAPWLTSGKGTGSGNTENVGSSALSGGRVQSGMEGSEETGIKTGESGSGNVNTDGSKTAESGTGEATSANDPSSAGSESVTAPDDKIPTSDAAGTFKREILFKNVETHERITDGCMADIMIRYANGEEYTVLKNVILYTGTTEEEEIHVFAELTTVELLYLSSARTDLVIYADTELYPVVNRNRTGTDGVGNYRPVKDIITLINEEGFIPHERTDELFLARERLEERLLNSSVYYRQAIQDALQNGLYGETGSGYWLIN